MKDIRQRPDSASVIAAARSLNARFPRAYWLATVAPRLAVGEYWIRRATGLGLGHSLKELYFPKYKTSDTVFVLATGASINRYEPSRWEVIRRHDSIGLNFFLLHDFVPTFHVLEGLREVHGELLRLRWESYRHVPLILKTQVSNLAPRRVRKRLGRIAQNLPENQANLYLSLDLLAAGTKPSEVLFSYKLMKRLGLFRAKPRFKLLTKRRGSISYVINLAVRIGYKRIVLCGVDLNHTEYFYDSRREELKARGLPVPPNLEMGTVHSTNDPRKHPITIEDVILAMNEAVLAPLDVQLYVGDRSSALFPKLAEFPW